MIADRERYDGARLKREEMIEAERLRSYLGVPLLFGDRLVGTLEMASDRPNAFNQDHQRLLMLVATQAAAALERARLFDELSRRLQDARLLAEVNQAIAGTLDLDQVLNLILEACRKAIPAAHKGSLFLRDQQSGELRSGGGWLQPAGDRRGADHAGAGVREAGDRHGQAGGDPRYARPGALSGWTGPGGRIRSAAAAPVQVNDQTIGALCIDSASTPHAF